MKVLIVMGGYFPGKKFGGPPVSVDNFCSLMKNVDCYILTYDHDLGETTKYKDITEGWNDRGNCKVLYVTDHEYKKTTFNKTINDIQPDIIYLQGLFQSCVLPCLQLAKRHNIPVLLAPRGELCAGAMNIKKWKKIPYIEIIRALGLVKKIHWQSTSDEETDAIKSLMKAKADNIHRLDNIPSIPKSQYQRRKKGAGEGRFVFLSRIHPKKNLLSAIRYFENVEGKVWFDIFGSIEDEEYWKQCQDVITKLPKNVKVEYKGMVTHDHVHEVFSHYDAFLFPTLSENYGHVIAESLMVGTPVIISDQTPWRGLEEAGGGWDLNLENELEFHNAIERIIKSDEQTFETYSVSAKKFVENAVHIQSIENSYSKTLKEICRH